MVDERRADVGAELLAAARAIGKSSVAVVGTSKNAGKSVTIAALADALAREKTSFGLVSSGRDGEAVDVLEGFSKPRFWLHPGATFATAACLVPRSPAGELLEIREETCALGPLAVVRVRAAGYAEIAGPAAAAALRRIVETLRARTDFLLIDGAVDRIAALRSEDAIVVAVGAAGGATIERAGEEAAGLVAKLQVEAYDPALPSVAIDGALTADHATAFLRTNETRQIVVGEPSQFAFSGRAFVSIAGQLALRCRRPFNPIACTVAPSGPQRAFEPRDFAREVAVRTGLPVFDAYAGLRTQARAA